MEISKAWHLIIDNRWLGLKGENYIEMLAERWNFTTDVFLKHPNSLIIIHYEEFVKDKIGEISRLAEKLDLSQVNDISNKMNIQFQPPGNKNISWYEFFGENNLCQIESICGDRMRLLNYLPVLKQLDR